MAKMLVFAWQILVYVMKLAMIYSDEFVWLHFPRCAGTLIETLFRQYFSKQPGLFQDIVDIEKDPLITWHDSVADRESRDPEFTLGERAVLCSFRRLPFWLESRYSFEVKRSPDLPHRPELLLEGRFFEANGCVHDADWYVRKYLPEPILNSGKVRFIRTEFFKQDFKEVFGHYLDLSLIPDSEYELKVNASESFLPAGIRDRLYGTNRVYELCEYWRTAERIAYGS